MRRWNKLFVAAAAGSLMSAGCGTSDGAGTTAADTVAPSDTAGAGDDATGGDTTEPGDTATLDDATALDDATGTEDDATGPVGDSFVLQDVVAPPDTSLPDTSVDTYKPDTSPLADTSEPDIFGDLDAMDFGDIFGDFDAGGPPPDVFIPLDDPPHFERLTITEDAPGAAWLEVGDIDLDGKLDLLVSEAGVSAGGFGVVPPGEVRIFSYGDDLTTWTPTPLLTAAAAIPAPNEPKAFDIDEDGDLDVFIPAGDANCATFALLGGAPCGAIVWFEQDSGVTPATWTKHDIVPEGAEHVFHRVLFADLDGDAILDLITVGETAPGLLDGAPGEAVTQWFKGTTEGDRFEKTPHIIGYGLGALPVAADIDEDGDIDLLSAENAAGLGASFAWFEQTEAPSDTTPDGGWSRHIISDGVGPSTQFMLVSDLFGDGMLRGIGTNHSNTTKGGGIGIPGFPGFGEADPWESAVYAFALPADLLTPWDVAPISEKIQAEPGDFLGTTGAPGRFDVGDVDGDGDYDVVVSGEGDNRVFWLEQTVSGAFTMHVLEETLPGAGSVRIVDLDGDTKNEIVLADPVGGKVFLYRWIPQ
jgi:hypothetical protein